MFLDVPASIIYPPPGGWPNMTPEVSDSLGKDPEVITRPYCLPGCQFQVWKTSVDKLKEGKEEREDLLLDTESEEYQFGGKIPKYCVGLTYALNISEYVMLLNVRTGLVHCMDCPEEILKACDPQPSRLVYPLEGEAKAEQDRGVLVVHEEEDDAEASDDNSEHETPPTSDDGGGDENDEPDDSEDDDDESIFVEWGPCWPVRHFFTMLKNHFIKLNFIPHSSQYVIKIWTERYTDHEQIPEGFAEFLQSIYHKHGWPDLEVYQKAACLAELEIAMETQSTKYYNLDQYFQNREY